MLIDPDKFGRGRIFFPSQDELYFLTRPIRFSSSLLVPQCTLLAHSTSALYTSNALYFANWHLHSPALPTPSISLLILSATVCPTHLCLYYTTISPSGMCQRVTYMMSQYFWHVQFTIRVSQQLLNLFNFVLKSILWVPSKSWHCKKKGGGGTVSQFKPSCGRIRSIPIFPLFSFWLLNICPI